MPAAALPHPARMNIAAAPFGGPIAEEEPPGGSLQLQRSGSEGEQLPGQRPRDGSAQQRQQGSVAEPEGHLPDQRGSRQGPGAPDPQPAAQQVDAILQGNGAPAGEQGPGRAEEGVDADAAATDKQGGSQSRRSLLDRLLTGPPPPATKPCGVPPGPPSAVPRAAPAPSASAAASSVVHGGAQAAEPPLPSSVGSRIHSAPAASVVSDHRATRHSPAVVPQDPPVLEKSASDGGAAANGADSGSDDGDDDDGRDPELADALDRALARAAGPSTAGLSAKQLSHRGNKSAGASPRHPSTDQGLTHRRCIVCMSAASQRGVHLAECCAK